MKQQRYAGWVVLFLVAMLGWGARAHAACSPYLGKVVFNEVYNPASGTTYVELRVLDPGIAAATSSFAGWKVRLFKKTGASTSSAEVDLSSVVTDIAKNACGQTSAWLRVPDSSLGGLIDGSNPNSDLNFVLYETSGSGRMIDLLRLGNPVSIYSGFESCPTIESALPSSRYDDAWSSNGTKNWYRNPDGTGTWTSTDSSNVYNTQCANNNGGGTFLISKVAGVTSVNTNTSFSFTLYAQNAATGSNLTGVTVTDNLNNAGLSFVSCTTASGTCTHSAGVVTWNIGSVAKGTLLSATLTVQSATAGTKTNTISTNAANTPDASASVNVLAAGPHHLQIEYPGDGLTCSPSTVTVKACADASCAALYGGGVTGTLSPGGAAFAIGASGQTTSTVSSTSSPANLSASFSPAAVSATTCLNTVTGSTSCSMVFSDTGFIVAASAGGVSASVPAQIAGTPSGTYYLRAVKTNTATKACEAALAGPSSVNMAHQCNNPTTCSPGNLMSVNGGGASTAIPANPASGVTAYAAVPLTFDANGNAPFTLTYGDVGLVTLFFNKTLGAATLSGASNAFVVKPAGFTVSNITQTAAPQLANPAAVDANGSRFVMAGEPFSARVTATTATGATAPNYGRETVPEGVLLTPALVLPAGGNAGVVSNATVGAFASGVATPTNLAWSEVGIMRLTPSVGDGDYLGAGNVTGTTTGNIGRFYPARFAISGASVSNACSAAAPYTYFGEDGFTAALTLTAQNTSGATTTNYTGAFARLGLASWGSYGFSAATLPAGSVLGSSATAPAGTWSNGVAAVTARQQISRPTALTGPTTVTVSAAPTDGEVPASAPATALGSVALRYGRLQVLNAYGSELLALPMTLRAQYWNGSAWSTNADDSCTVISAPVSGAGLTFYPEVAAGAMGNHLSAGDTTASVNASGRLAAGSAGLRFSAPGAGNSGYVDVSIALAARPWLRFPWNGAGDADPTARATFGIYKSRLIYSRENY